MEIITRNYNGVEINFSTNIETELYINATKTAKVFNKKPDDWLRTKQTKDYIEAMVSRFGNMRNDDLVVVQQGGNAKEQGTWIHKKLIIAFARWLKPDFAVWCDLQIEEILSENSSNGGHTDLDYMKDRTELIKLSNEQLIAFKSSFYEIGITRPEELAITSNRAVSKETGIDFIQLAELKGISTPEKYFTVTELCQKVMDSEQFLEKAKKLVSTKKGDKPRPQNLNRLLEKNGYQTKVDSIWRPTEKAKDFSDFVQNKSKYSEKTVYHLVWKIDILESLF